MGRADALGPGGSSGIGPDVSVVIPTFNRAALVGRAIDSALDDSGGLRTEVVVADDGSTDDTLDRLGRYGSHIVVEALGSNLGRSHARNAGLRRSEGEWVKFLDSDDVLESGALAREVAAGRAAAADIVATASRKSESAGGPGPVRIPPERWRGIDSVLAGEGVPTSAALYRRAFLGDLEWNPARTKLDDWDFFVRATLKGARLISLPIVSYTWVSHSGQVTKSSTLLDNARNHHAILGEIEAWLVKAGELTAPRRKRLAQYFYKELRVLSLHDRPAFEKGVAHILELDSRFEPVDEERQAWMRGLARILGFRRALLLHSGVKRFLRGRRGGNGAGLPESKGVA
jgi:glycosyltransferase involved in cell wall biosynthesis